VLAWSSKYLGDALASRPVLVQLPGGELRALIRLSSDTTIAEGVPAPLASPKVRRVSWRELPDTSK
jgi:type IV pilus assembly protein PilY1